MRENSLEKRFKIGYFESDPKLRLTLSALAVYFQETAVSHSDSLGFTAEWFAKEQRGWVVVNYSVEIDRAPKNGEELTVKTWADFRKRTRVQRSFEVTDGEGKRIIKAVSRWAMMDLNSRKPLKAEEYIAEKLSSDKEPVMPADYVITKPETFSLSRRFFVTRRDTDSNAHVNNIKYFEWATDEIPDYIYDNCEITSVKASFKKECRKGAEILSKTAISESDGFFTVTSCFCDPNTPSIVYFEAASVWRKAL